MKITIELWSGANHSEECNKRDIQKNIDSLNRYINGKQLCNDDTLILDTISILEGIKTKLPD